MKKGNPKGICKSRVQNSERQTGVRLVCQEYVSYVFWIYSVVLFWLKCYARFAHLWRSFISFGCLGWSMCGERFRVVACNSFDVMLKVVFFLHTDWFFPGPGTYMVIKCGASGHNIRARPGLKASPIGMVTHGKKMKAVEDVRLIFITCTHIVSINWEMIFKINL